MTNQVKAEQPKVKGSLEDLLNPLSEKQDQVRKLQEEIAELEAQKVQRGTKEFHNTDFDSLTKEERISEKAYYKIVNNLNSTVYEFHGGQIDTIFGKDNNMRQAFLDGRLGRTFNYDSKHVNFLYLLKLVKE